MEKTLTFVICFSRCKSCPSHQNVAQTLLLPLPVVGVWLCSLPPGPFSQKAVPTLQSISIMSLELIQSFPNYFDSKGVKFLERLSSGLRVGKLRPSLSSPALAQSVGGEVTTDLLLQV